MVKKADMKTKNVNYFSNCLQIGIESNSYLLVRGQYIMHSRSQVIPSAITVAATFNYKRLNTFLHYV